MRICKCGGIVEQHALTKGREAWTCRSCGRYEIFKVIKELNKGEEWTTLKDSGNNDSLSRTSNNTNNGL